MGDTSVSCRTDEATKEKLTEAASERGMSVGVLGGRLLAESVDRLRPVSELRFTEDPTSDDPPTDPGA